MDGVTSDSKRFYKHIMNRTLEHYLQLNLCKLLKNYEMERYLNVCVNRIENANLIDFEEICPDFDDFGNLLLTYAGLKRCKNILVGYIGIENYQICEQYLRLHNEMTDATNDILLMYREYETETIKDMIKEAQKDIDFLQLYDVKKAIKIAKIELRSRGWLNTVRLRVREWLKSIYLHIKYYWVYKVFRDFEKELERYPEN